MEGSVAMLETELRELFEMQASAEQPPSRLNIKAISRAARSRLRIRRLAGTATTLVVASAVAAVVLTHGPQAGRVGPVGPGHRHHRVHHTLGQAPRYFDPLRPYLSFGWLPPRTRVVYGDTGTTEQDLIAGGPGTMVQLWAYAAGQCSWAHMLFRCAGQSSEFDVHLTSRLAGHPFFEWGDAADHWRGRGFLIWRYARDGWAELQFTATASQAVRVAEHVIFGGPAAPLRFPARLTGMPGWRLRFAQFSTGRDGSLSTRFGFATGAGLYVPSPTRTWYPVPTGFPTVTIKGPKPCTDNPAGPTLSVITGHRITFFAPSRPKVARYVCVANIDGLTVGVGVTGRHPIADATTIFAHLRLFGPDPANWTTKPVG
jgi:hypothetical protein